MKQIERTLPRKDWEGVIICENNEPLVEIKETARLRFSESVNKFSDTDNNYTPSHFMRKTSAEKVARVSEKLPKGYTLIFIEGWRSMTSQQIGWDTRWNRVKTMNPDWDDAKIDQAVRLVVARPHPLANHHCGGATDVTLAHEDGTLVDMGTPYPSRTEDMDLRDKFPMFTNLITPEQAANRVILREAMEGEGFVWYPEEWWHYCWGDRMWAVYTKQQECFYGPIELSKGL